MRKMYIYYILSILLLSCDSDEKAIDFVFNNIETGAILRTTNINNLTVDPLIPQRAVNFSLEYQNGSNPDGLESVAIEISFLDNTIESQDLSKTKTLYKTLSENDFQIGVNGFLTTEVNIETSDFLELFNLSIDQIKCTDIFRIDLTLNQQNGDSFSTSNSIGPIISLGGALNSPFTYDVVVTESVEDNFISGIYSYESIVDGFDGPTFITPEVVEITTPRPNTRRFEIFRDTQSNFGGIFVRAEIEFTIACDQAILTRYVRSAIVCGFGVEGDVHVLLGPDVHLDDSIDELDDSVFDLRFLESYEGNDGFCGWPLTSSEIRFSQQ